MEAPLVQVAGEENEKQGSPELIPTVTNTPFKRNIPVFEKIFPKVPKETPKTCTYWSAITHELRLDAIDSEESKSREFGTRTAWCPRRDILEKWNEDLLPQINSIVSADRSKRYIYKRSSKQYPCIVDLWMICDGSDWEDAHPTVVATCVEGRIAKRTIQVLQNNPQFQDLNLGFRFLYWEEAVSLLAGAERASPEMGPFQGESLRLGGSQVVITSVPISRASRWNQATIGGVLLLNGRYYGLCTAHPFYQSSEEEHPASAGNNGRDGSSALSESSEDECDLEDYLKELNGLQAFENGREDCSQLAPSAEPSGTVVYLIPRPVVSDTRAAEEGESSRLSGPHYFQTSSLVGFLPKTPIATSDDSLERTDSPGSQWISRSLDWALVRIADPRFWGPNLFKSISGATSLISFVSYSPPYGVVMIATYHEGPRLTHCWGRKAGLMLPNAIELQEVWCLDSSCCK